MISFNAINWKCCTSSEKKKNPTQNPPIYFKGKRKSCLPKWSSRRNLTPQECKRTKQKLRGDQADSWGCHCTVPLLSHHPGCSRHTEIAAQFQKEPNPLEYFPCRNSSRILVPHCEFLSGSVGTKVQVPAFMSRFPQPQKRENQVSFCSDLTRNSSPDLANFTLKLIKTSFLFLKMPFVRKYSTSFTLGTVALTVNNNYEERILKESLQVLIRIKT